MAYAIPKDAECTEPGCARRAEYVVKNNRNETIRECCRRHADALVRKISAEEDRRADAVRREQAHG